MDTLDKELIRLMGLDVMVSPEEDINLGYSASRSFENALPERFYDPNHVQIKTGNDMQFLDDRPSWEWYEHPDAGSPRERQMPLPGEYESNPIIASIINALANRR